MKSVCKAHVAVVGRGIMGHSLALRLKSAGFKVSLLGPLDKAGTASTAAVGVSAVKGLCNANSPLFASKLLGHSNFPSWCRYIKQHGGSTITLRKGEVFEPFLDHQDYQRIKERVYRRRFQGLSGVVTHRERGSTHSGAIQYTGDFSFSPVQMMQSLQQACESQGIRIDDRKVEALELSSRFCRVIYEKNNSAAFDIVFLAAGVFSHSILEKSGISHFPLHFKVGVTASVDCRQSCSPKTLLFDRKSLVIDHHSFRYGAVDLEKNGCFESPHPFQVLIESELRSLNQAYHIGLKTSQPKIKMGARSLTKDRLPLVGQLGKNGRLWVSCGLYKTGIQIADIVAMELVRQLLGQQPSWPFSDFSPHRYSSN